MNRIYLSFTPVKPQILFCLSETKELIQNLKEINKELKLAHEKRKEEKKKEYEAKSQISANDKRTARIEKLQNEERDILTKKRSTIKIFSEIKVFLKDLLPKISPATINEGNSNVISVLPKLITLPNSCRQFYQVFNFLLF